MSTPSKWTPQENPPPTASTSEPMETHLLSSQTGKNASSPDWTSSVPSSTSKNEVAPTSNPKKSKSLRSQKRPEELMEPFPKQVVRISKEDFDAFCQTLLEFKDSL